MCRWHIGSRFFASDSLDLLLLNPEKQWPRPPGASDQARDLGETSVARALVLVPVAFDTHQVNPVAPLANQSCSGAHAWSTSDGGILSFFKCATEIEKALLPFPTNCATVRTGMASRMPNIATRTGSRTAAPPNPVTAARVKANNAVNARTTHRSICGTTDSLRFSEYLAGVGRSSR